PNGSGYLNTCVNPRRAEAYYRRAKQLMALNLDTLQERVLFQAEPGWKSYTVNCTADGKTLCTSTITDAGDRPGVARYWQARLPSRILAIPVDGGPARVVREENYWLSHVNTSPTRANLITFCHEGPWAKVDQLIWGCDLNTGEVWKIRPSKLGDRVG